MPQDDKLARVDVVLEELDLECCQARVGVGGGLVSGPMPCPSGQPAGCRARPGQGALQLLPAHRQARRNVAPPSPLHPRQDTLIGDELLGLKGISGGQRRRVSVGIELVKQPQVRCGWIDGSITLRLLVNH